MTSSLALFSSILWDKSILFWIECVVIIISFKGFKDFLIMKYPPRIIMTMRRGNTYKLYCSKERINFTLLVTEVTPRIHTFFWVENNSIYIYVPVSVSTSLIRSVLKEVFDKSMGEIPCIKVPSIEYRERYTPSSNDSKGSSFS